MKEQQLVNTRVRLEKFPGKGGWTYAPLPTVEPDKHSYFGWIRVKGSIDDYELRQYNLMPMGNGKLFLPVNAKVRKLINKKEGDTVKVILYRDESRIEVHSELMECLADEPVALANFQKLTEANKKQWVDFIQQPKGDEKRIARMAKAVNMLAAGEKYPVNFGS